nr:MAG TPA: hypothetical protein [Caudoviricetes sp.]
MASRLFGQQFRCRISSSITYCCRDCDDTGHRPREFEPAVFLSGLFFLIFGFVLVLIFVTHDCTPDLDWVYDLYA